jgi:hypothetical protein
MVKKELSDLKDKSNEEKKCINFNKCKILLDAKAKGFYYQCADEDCKTNEFKKKCCGGIYCETCAGHKRDEKIANNLVLAVK